ncbi:MAG: hypothetical protein Tsb0020_31700 [Haliangiales bacterium]
MRCPHCDGEIHDGSRFCGICGRQLVAASAPASPQQPAPASSAGQARAAAGASAAPTNHAAKRPRQAAQPGTRSAPAGVARVVTMMALNLVLLSAGGWMIGSFVDDCRGAQRGLTAPGEPAPGERGDGNASRPSAETEGGATAEPPQ